MRTVAITNQKGGSGKTTTAVNLGATLAEQGRRVLLVDLDAQASASSWLGCQGGDKGIYGVFADNGNLSDVITDTAVPGLDLAPASSWLVGIDKILAGDVGTEAILRRQLSGLQPDRYDYTLIDCPPALGILTVNALSAAREVLVTVEAHVMALAGLAQLLQTVETVKNRLNPELAISGILACRVDARTRHAQEVVEQLRGRFSGLVYRSIIRENIRMAEAPSFAQPITIYDTRSTGAADYRALAAEVIAQEVR
jgi:chromosome partitioning protein